MGNRRDAHVIDLSGQKNERIRVRLPEEFWPARRSEYFYFPAQLFPLTPDKTKNN
jgi:hypothetical protein